MMSQLVTSQMLLAPHPHLLHGAILKNAMGSGCSQCTAVPFFGELAWVDGSPFAGNAWKVRHPREG